MSARGPLADGSLLQKPRIEAAVALIVTFEPEGELNAVMGETLPPSSALELTGLSYTSNRFAGCAGHVAPSTVNHPCKLF